MALGDCLYMCEGDEVLAWEVDAEEFSKEMGYTKKPVRIRNHNVVVRSRQLTVVAPTKTYYSIAVINRDVFTPELITEQAEASLTQS